MQATPHSQPTVLSQSLNDSGHAPTFANGVAVLHAHRVDVLLQQQAVASLPGNCHAHDMFSLFSTHGMRAAKTMGDDMLAAGDAVMALRVNTPQALLGHSDEVLSGADLVGFMRELITTLQRFDGFTKSLSVEDATHIAALRTQLELWETHHAAQPHYIGACLPPQVALELARLTHRDARIVVLFDDLQLLGGHIHFKTPFTDRAALDRDYGAAAHAWRTLIETCRFGLRPPSLSAEQLKAVAVIMKFCATGTRNDNPLRLSSDERNLLHKVNGEIRVALGCIHDDARVTNIQNTALDALYAAMGMRKPRKRF